MRETAVRAGLTVSGEIIEDPGPAPAAPGPVPTGPGVTPESVAAHDEATAAADAHVNLVNAYNAAQHGADAARQISKFATDTVKNVWADISGKWFVVIGDLANGAAGTLAAKHGSILSKQAKFMADESSKFLQLAKNAPEGTTASMMYKDFDASRAAAYSADDAAKAAADTDTKAERVGLKLGGGLAAAGVVYDSANGKPVDQAVVSGAAGFGASTAAGAAIGSAIRVPVLGTAVGAAGGAAVGMFTSGAVDSIYQNGIGAVGGAIDDGVEAVGDAGKAIGGAVSAAWNVIF